jgi:hypothetical protein
MKPRPTKQSASPSARCLIASVAVAGIFMGSAAFARGPLGGDVVRDEPDTRVVARGAKSNVGDSDGSAAVTFTGFDEQSDGASRLYVKLSRAVTVEPASSGTHLEYLLLGATIPIRNNKNPLITSHFGVQVVSARLVDDGAEKQKGKTKKRAKAKPPPPSAGVRLLVETREAVRPQHRMVKNQDGTATFVVEFPKPSRPPPPEPEVIAPPKTAG